MVARSFRRGPVCVASFLLAFLLLTTACDSGSPAPADEDPSAPITLDRVQYVNTTLPSEVVDAAKAGSFAHAMTLTLTFSQEIPLEDVERIRIFATQGFPAAGWDLRSADFDAVSIDGPAMTVANLVFSEPARGDRSFQLDVHTTDGDTINTDFVHKGPFPAALTVDERGWTGPNDLSATLEPTPQYGSVGRFTSVNRVSVEWMNGDTALGAADLAVDATDPIAVTAPGAPATASAYRLTVTGRINGIQARVLTARQSLPVRLPDGTVFIDDLEVSREDVVIERHEDRMFVLNPSSGMVHLIDADGTVVGSHQTRPGRSPVLAAASPTDAYVGYGDGVLERINVATGTATELATFPETTHRHLLALDGAVLSGVEVGSYDEDLYLIDASTGALLDNIGWRPYVPGDLVYSEATGRAYMDYAGISPNDLASFAVDLEAGTLSDYRDSAYHGDYDLFAPLVLLEGGTRVLTGAGTVFSLSANRDEDMVFATSIVHGMRSAVVREGADQLLVARGPSTRGYGAEPSSARLDVYGADTYDVLRTIDLPAAPLALIPHTNGVTVLAFSGAATGRLLVLPYDDADLKTTHTAAVPVVQER